MAVFCNDSSPVKGSSSILGNKIQHLLNTDVLLRRDGKQRSESPLGERVAQIFFDHLGAEGPLFKELFSQCIVRFSDVFHERFIITFSPFFEFASDRCSLKLARAISLVSEHLHVQNIHDLVKAQAGINGEGQRGRGLREILLDLFKYFVKVCMFSIQCIDGDHLCFFSLHGVIPGCIGADLHSHFRMDDDQRGVRGTDSAQRFTDEVQVPRSINEVEFFPVPVAIH